MHLAHLGNARFPKALNEQYRVCLATPCDPRRDCKVRIDLKQMCRRLTCLNVTAEMGEGGRETAVSSANRRGSDVGQPSLPRRPRQSDEAQ